MKNFNLIEMAKAMKEHKLRHMWRYAAMMALLLTLVCGNVWGADYTKDDIGKAKSNITVSIGGDKVAADDAKVCNTTSNVIAITGSANGDYTDDYIEIKAASGYTLDSPIYIEGSVNKAVKDGGGPFAVAAVFWTGDAAATFSSVTTIGLTYKDATTGCDAVSLAVPSGTRTVRLYRAMKHTSSTFNGSGTQEGAGQTAYIKTITATASAACAAPTAVYVTQTAGSSDMIAGESFTLSAATSTGVEEGATYQWYRNSTEVGTNSPTFTVASCTATDAGTYWCKITNPCSEDAHTTNVTGYGLKVWQVLLYSSSWNAYDLTSTGTKTGTLSRRLTPGTYYIKLTHNNGVDFGVNTGETISEITATTPSAWTLYNGQNNIKLTVTTAGYYTFDVDYTSADNPTLGVTFPSATISSCDKIYFCPTQNSIATGSAKFSIRFWNDTEEGWANCYLVDGTEYADDAKYVAFAPSTTNGWKKMIVVRDDAYASSFDGIWNQSQDISYNGYDYIVGTGWSDGKFTTNLNSFYSSTTPAMSASSYATTVDGTTNASTNLTGATISYASDNTSVASVNSSGVITGVAVGETTITASVGSCTVGSATVTVSRNTPTQYTVSGTTSICSGSNTNITLNGSETGASYQLKKGGVAEGDAKAGTGSSLTWSVSAAGTYTVSAVQTAKYTARDMSGSAVITVNTPVTISWNNAPANGTIGGSMTASVTTNYAAGVTYAVTSASPAGCVTIHETSGAISYVAAGTATITATVTGAGNYCSSANVTQSVTVNKKTPTKYDFSVNKTVLCGEETSTLTLEDSEDGVTYELREDSSHPIADTEKSGTGSALTWTGLGAGTYVVYAVADATYTERQMNSSKITVTTGTATSITTQPTNQEVTVDEEATLTVVAAGTSLSYQWKESATEDGTYSNVASSGTSASYSVTPAAAGTKWYKCVVTGTCGEVTTEARKIVANAAVTYTVTYVYNGATGGDDTPSATGASVTLPTPTKTGYILDGWYTTAGAKVDDGGETYSPTADITLYARWTETCSGGGGGSTTLFAWTKGTATDNISISGSGSESLTTSNRGTMSTGTSIYVKNSSASGKSLDHNAKGYKLGSNEVYIEIQGTSNFAAGDIVSVQGYDNASGANYFAISKSTLTHVGNATESDTVRTTAIDSDSEEIYDATLKTSIAGEKVHIFRMPGSSMFVKAITVTREGGSPSACNKVLYHGNGAESGYIYDPNVYDDNDDPVVLGNTTGTNGVAFVKDGYVFQGWATSAGGSVAYTAGDEIENIDDDVDLYAVWAEEVACSTDPTVTAGSNSAVTSTTATVTCASGISAFGGGCSISSYGFVLGTSENPTTSNTRYEVGTTYASTGASFSQNLTGLTKNTTYYVRPYATNSHGTAYGTQTSFTTLATYTVTYNGNGATSGDAPVDASSPYDAGSNVTVLDNTGDLAKTNYTFDGWATANDGTGTSYAAEGTISSIAANTTLYAKWKQTVTLKTGAQGSGADQTPYVYINGMGVSSFTAHTASGYSLQGYYTAGSGGVKVLNADGTFAAANVTDYITSSKWSRTGAAPTLYAQWRVSAGSTCYEWDADVTTPSTGTNSYDGLYLTAATIKNSVSFYSGHAADTCFSVSDQGKTLYGHLNGTEIDSVVFAASSSKAADNNTMVVIFCSTQTFDTANIIKVNNYQATLYTVNQNTAAKTVHRIKAPAGTKSFAIGRNYANITVSGTLHNSGERYLYYLKVCSASGGTHTISYDNGGGTGTMSAETDIEDDGSQTLTTNSFMAPTNFAFAGWVADVDVTIGGSTVTAGTLIANGATITNITMDIALTAKWSQTITLDDNDANHGTTGDGSATVYYNATSLASITHTTAASGYKLAGYYTAATSGTKVLNSDGSFAGDDITDWIDDGKWVQNDDNEPLLYAQYEVAGSIKWNLQVNSADAPIVTSSKNSSYTQISTSNMTNLDSIGLNITASKKGGMTSKITAPTAFDKDKYMKVTFQVASGYQFKPSSIKVPIQPVDGGADVKLVLVDNAATPDSIGKVQSSLSKGNLTTVEMTNSSAVFKGTVTLKIYCYGSSTGTYRLGTPIQIDGEIESTCTMPSYTSVSYSQTEYVQPASASAISVVGASGDPSYQWKYNSTGDRTSGTNCGTEASVTPSTESTGTLYYWCELTNACGTVKTPAVAITVSASKNEAPSIVWTDPASTPNYGGGGYTIRATVNDDSWDGSASDLTITAPAGIRIYNTTTGTDGSSKKYIEVKFDVQTAFDRETYSSNIPFTVSADATTSYNAISADHNVSYSACSGGGGSATEELMAVDASHMDNSTWKGGWVYDGIGMMRYGHGSSDISAGTNDANLKDLSYTMASGDITKYYKSSANHFGFYTEKAITGIRLYVYTSNDNVTVSNVYVANSAYTSGTPSSGAVSYEAEYNDDNDALRSGTHSGSAWVDITFDKEVAAEKYGQINLSNSVYIAGMAFISASGSGATLITTLAFASSSVTKAQSDANFTITPTKGDYSETLGAITYSSSNTDCATVNATTGEVTITATGSSNLTSRITATLAASGCYKSATAYYDLTVTGQECTITSAGTLSADNTVKCSSANVTLTLSGEDDGMTVTWYRDATDVTASVSDHTLTTSAAGSYSVVVSNATCSKRSNSITISNYSAEVAATKIVDKWYIKNGRVTPDIALWTLNEGTHLDSVTWSTTNATGLTIADFYESDGVVYLSGKEPNTNESSDAEYTLTLRVKDECENKTLLNTSAKQITLIHQKNTDKHVLAFVVTGTEKGGWTAGISADQTTNVELYNEIAKNFDVQATNIYSTDDEQKLKEYYSQFDILCITDYPNTKTKGVNSKSYVDAIGAMVDIRPILTMEAWVSGLTNWKSKGISGTPKSPTTRQYSMLLQCKDHEIFSGTNPTTVGSGDETMYRIDMVDKTMEEYATLDATYGAGAHESDKNYQYGKKPALQGFTYDASMSSLLPIGRIDDGEGNDLEVGVERQAVMEARLLVLGINGYAMERLDDDGLTIVINALKYLMKKNAEDISDCSNYFVGGAEGDPYSWKNLDNWSGSTLPDRTQEVRIVAPCVISDTIARASSVKIITGGTYSHGTKTANGSLTINPTGSLIVEGKIYAATAPNFFEQRTTEPENLVVKANESKTGTLIFDNENGDTQATIEMYSPSHWEVVAGKYVKYWSYVGMPIKDVHIPDYFYGAFTYYFNEAKGWEKRFDNDIMQPFEGIGLSMQEGHKETFYGTMVSTENTDITITNHTGYGDGDNLIGNSWTAPIQIANFDAEDFGSCWATVYIFNTGKGGNTYVNANADNDGAAKAGQWLGVPIGVAGLPEYSGLKVIPAMNAFLVHDTLPTSTTLHLDYDKLVREDATTNTQINEKMRAPSRHPRKKKDVDGLMRIRVVGEKTNTDVWMLQDERFSERYDNGWEAYFSGGDNRSPVLYAQSAVGPMGIVALQDLDGTVLGFAPSRDGNDYTFTFQYRGEDEYYLNDLKLQQSVLIDADNNYAFTYEKGDTNRFYVSRTPLAPQTPTGVDNASGATQSTKAIKVIYNGKLYIIRSGRVYSAEGILVK